MGKDKKHKKKHKKDKKKKSKKIKERRNVTSSSEDSSSEEEWVEKTPIVTNDSPKIRDEWMNIESIFSGKTRKELNDSKPKPEKEKEFNLLDRPGQSTRELNPYWKDGGTGLPPEKPYKKEDNIHSSQQRNRYFPNSSDSYNSVQNHKNSYVVSSDSDSSDYSVNKKNRSVLRDSKPAHENASCTYEGKKKMNFRRPDDSFEGDYRKISTNKNSDSYQDHKKVNFRKPDEENESSYRKSVYSSSTKKRWKKPSAEDLVDSVAETKRSSSEERVKFEEKDCEKSSSKPEVFRQVLSLNEMNELSASILKAELMGNKVLAEELKAKLKEARSNKDTTSSDLYDDKGRKVVILTETNSKGFTRPAKNVSNESQYSKKNKKAQTHEGKKRVRYFADDDKHSLKDLFEKEKYSSAYDQNSTFIKLSSRQRNDDMDDEAVFDSARIDDQDKEEKRKRNNVIKRQSGLEKVLDDCRFCLSDKNVSSDCIILMKEKVYLAVPSFQSLTERHCLIIPHYHIPCATMLDEDVWSEIMVLRKMLVKIFEKEDEDIIFFESAMNLHRHPHMILHCVPVPKEVGDTAPIYFKKAIMECESEWSNNKKLVELAGRDVRKAVPKGLPYFAVDFGLQSGFAHVIEDSKLFPHNFAQEIIGGMLDLDHKIWRKLHKDTTENIIKKVKSIKDLLDKEEAN